MEFAASPIDFGQVFKKWDFLAILFNFNRFKLED